MPIPSWVGWKPLKKRSNAPDCFKKHAADIQGILVVLPNFGDEKGVAETIKLANLNVPVLIQGYPDALGKMDVVNRRDAWCGKISVCNNLYQYGIKYSLTTNTWYAPRMNPLLPTSIILSRYAVL